MKPLRISSVFIILLFSFSVTTQCLAAEAPLAGLDQRIEALMADWNVPGVALAIVKDDTVIHSAGYGVRETGTEHATNDETIFAIGSSSKAFTAAALAILVDEGKVSWDDPVTDHLPWFKLYDPYVSREMRIRDLLAHNSGLSRGDRVWYGTGISREEIVRRARYLQPTKSFRATFQYNNTMFIAAGLVIEAISGQNWDEFVTQRILQPLGMNTSNTTIRDLQNQTNVASPHMDFQGIARTVPWRNIDNAGPAGSINSNVREMINWVRLQLGNGEFDGKRIISEQNILEMQSAQMHMSKEGLWGLLFADSSLLSYGLGWFLAEHQGRLMVNHGGNIDGNTAFVSFMPEENLGLVLLTNLNGANGFIISLNYEIYDRLLGTTGKDWSADLLQVLSDFKAKAKEAAQKIVDARVTGTSASHPLDAYSGNYDNEMYPGVAVENRDGTLVVTFADAFEATLEHWHFDTFKATWNLPDTGDGPPNLVRFELGVDGQPAVIHLDIEGEVPFNRRVEKEQQ
jgi:CubicO group peptidase (beta-lactamase class C family)